MPAKISLQRLKQHPKTAVFVCLLVAICYVFYHNKQNSPPKFPPRRSQRHFHLCNYQRVPHVTGVLETAQILSYTNFSFLRIGDAELDLIMGKDLSFQKSNPILRNRLIQILHSSYPGLMIGLPDVFSGCGEHQMNLMNYYMDRDGYRQLMLKYIHLDQQYFQTFITTPFFYNRYTNCIPVDATYKALRSVWKDKDIVILRGNNTQVYDYDVYDTAKSQRILYAPRYSAVDHYESLREQLFKENPNSLYIIAAGTVSKMLVYDLARAGRRAIDLGHLAKDYNLYAAGKTQKLTDDFWHD